MHERFDDQERLIAQWWPASWASVLDGERAAPISIFDICELRGAVDTDRIAAALPPIHWVGRTDDDPSFVAGVTPVRAVHFTQLRDAMADLWKIAGLGHVPEFDAGPIIPGKRLVSVRDPLDLRAWVEAYEAARPDLAARVVWRFGTEPRPWPPVAYPRTATGAVEMWDTTGHSLLLQDDDPARLTELRRIDGHWHRTDIVSTANGPVVTIAPDPLLASSVPRAALRLFISSSLAERDGFRFLHWDATVPLKGGRQDAGRDAFGRVVRVVEDGAVVVRLAYDGLGRLRKWVDTRTWHILGPDYVVPAEAGTTA